VNIYLIGARGSGKSEVGRCLAARLHRAFCDMDAELVQRLGRSIHDVVHAQGWPAFRRAERRLVAELTARSEWVVSTGGGVVLDEANIADLRRSGRVVWLRAAPETLLQRLQADRGQRAQRPPLTPCRNLYDEIRQTLSERDALYRQAMHVCVETDHRCVEAVCRAVAAALELDPCDAPAPLDNPTRFQ
jgi:shikimate kinase